MLDISTASGESLVHAYSHEESGVKRHCVSHKLLYLPVDLLLSWFCRQMMTTQSQTESGPGSRRRRLTNTWLGALPQLIHHIWQVLANFTVPPFVPGTLAPPPPPLNWRDWFTTTTRKTDCFQTEDWLVSIDRSKNCRRACALASPDRTADYVNITETADYSPIHSYPTYTPILPYLYWGCEATLYGWVWWGICLSFIAWTIFTLNNNRQYLLSQIFHLF